MDTAFKEESMLILHIFLRDCDQPEHEEGTVGCAVAEFPPPLFCLAENTGVCFLSARFWNGNECQIFFGPESQIPAPMSSMIERHISLYFSLALLRGSHLQGHVHPSQALWDQAEDSSLPILTTSLCSQEATATLFWKQVGGGKTFFFPLPFYSFASFNYRRTEFELFLSSSFPSFLRQCF